MFTCSLTYLTMRISSAYHSEEALYINYRLLSIQLIADPHFKVCRICNKTQRLLREELKLVHVAMTGFSVLKYSFLFMLYFKTGFQWIWLLIDLFEHFRKVTTQNNEFYKYYLKIKPITTSLSPPTELLLRKCNIYCRTQWDLLLQLIHFICPKSLTTALTTQRHLSYFVFTLLSLKEFIVLFMFCCCFKVVFMNNFCWFKAFHNSVLCTH